MLPEITKMNFHSVKEETSNLVIDFWASWCGPCKTMLPVIEELAKEYDGKITFYKCNVDETEDLPEEMKIKSIPTFVFFKHGEEYCRITGAVQRSILREKCEELLNS